MKGPVRLGGIWLRFVAIFLIFIAVNLLAAHMMSDCGLPAVLGADRCADDMVRAGWPLEFYEGGGIASQNSLSLPSLAADLLAGAVISFAVAWGSLRLGRG